MTEITLLINIFQPLAAVSAGINDEMKTIRVSLKLLIEFMVYLNFLKYFTQYRQSIDIPAASRACLM